MARFTKEDAKAMSILDVAHSLGMEMKQDSSQEWYWVEHDSLKINTRKNRFDWYSRDIHGDVINLVETIKDVDYKQAMHYLRTGEFPKTELTQKPKEPFKYLLGKYEQPFVEAHDYLKEVRGLSDDTINFFGQAGVLAQAIKKAPDDYLEPVVVFKSLDKDKRVIGASLQGIEPNRERYEGKGYLKQILYNSDGMSGMRVDIGTPRRLVFAEAPIDLMSYYEANKGNLSDVRLVAMDGLKAGTISRYTMELLAELQGKSDYKPDLSKVGEALEKLAKLTTFFQNGKNSDLITLAVDNDKAGRDFIERLQAKGIPVQPDLPPLPEGAVKMDWNDYVKERKQGKQMQVEEPQVEYSVDKVDKNVVPTNEKAPEMFQGQTFDRTSGGTGSLQSEAEGSTIPVLESSTFEQTVTSHPTSSYPYLHFSTNFSEVQRRIGNYHPITSADLKRLNQYAPSIQSTAQWYLKEMAGSSIHFIYANQGEQELLEVEFQKENFIHLTGIRPVEDGRGAADFVGDFAMGRGDYDSILISNSIKDKLQVLPMLPDILDPNSFVLDDLSSVEKLQKLDMSEAIKSKDEDFLLLFKDTESAKIPASLMKLKGELKHSLVEANEKVILGIYRERDGVIDQISINKEYVKDGGKEFLSILKNHQLEPLSESPNQTLQEQKEVKPPSVFEDKIRPVSANTQDTPAKKSLAEILESKDNQELFDHLTEGMKEYVNSDKYKEFLDAISKFHDYSPYNIALMLNQNPDITQVASYQKWKTDFDRQVQKGEKGIKIWVPMTFTVKDENGQPKLDKDGREQTVTRFKLGSVFDVSQTQGKELPQPVYNLEGNVPDYQNIYRAARQVAKDNGVSVSFQVISSGANGYYNPTKKEIAIADKQMSEAQILKTLFHEMAHSDLHHKDDGYTRSEQELQAESVAYVVANYYGFDTSSYSFGYLHSWSTDKNGHEDLIGQLKVVQEESKSLIQRIDTRLEQIKTKSLTTNKFQDKIAAAKQKSKEQAQQKASEAQQKMPKKEPSFHKDL